MNAFVLGSFHSLTRIRAHKSITLKRGVGLCSQRECILYISICIKADNINNSRRSSGRAASQAIASQSSGTDTRPIRDARWLCVARSFMYKTYTCAYLYMLMAHELYIQGCLHNHRGELALPRCRRCRRARCAR